MTTFGLCLSNGSREHCRIEDRFDRNGRLKEDVKVCSLQKGALIALIQFRAGRSLLVLGCAASSVGKSMRT